ncbi:MATE family efflux transporter [Oceanobacter sp. 5_MG-2023]|uniref:MATE family efflux transporter n=1 Tax=Oceanobacter sp. 5_MG-2023 TaxID=3062645 RepID=UPI0026E19934|nr:MATE family efflux transporter [Oceanobacter sp. 5_MG-2023]MDO6681116.1 MATE family efflux transporter [Oceanobacter sp. 5_MG-2023]
MSVEHWLGKLLRIEPQRLTRIFGIGLPIIGAMLSQSLINLIDAAMVGRLGDAALAAIGIGGYASFMMVSIVMGLAAAVQALVARRIGAGKTATLHEPLMAGLLSAILLAVPLSLLFIFLAPSLIPTLTNNSDVAAIATPYFQWRTAALIAVAMNFVYRGFWSGIGETRFYLQVLLLMHVVNISLSYLLVFGIGDWQGLGAVGSGIGTAMALVFGSALLSWLTFTHKRQRLGQIKFPTRATLLQLIRLAWPNSAQQTLFALGISILFWIIGQIGTREQAIGHILISLQLILILPAVGMGIAATSLVSHALGAGHPQDAHRWGWDVVRVATLTLALLGLPLCLFPEWILGIFTTETKLIQAGILPLQITGIFIALEVTAMVLTQALLGAGASRQIMKINLTMQWCVFLPLAYFVGPVLGFGLVGVWILQGVQRTGLSLIYSLIWQRRQWVHLSV